MKRMIDAVNGLAITTDIMLKELERSLEDAKKEAKVRAFKPFKNGQDFVQWFKLTYKRQMRPEVRKLWACNGPTACRLINLCSGQTFGLPQFGQFIWPGERYKGPPACPIVFKELIERHRLLQTKPPKKQLDKLDICPSP